MTAAAAHGLRRMIDAMPLALLTASPAIAQSIPLSDTEDATIGSVAVGEGSLHVVGRLNLRNGDYARGAYDDDASDLHRLPVHIEAGLVQELHRPDGGAADAWIEFHSSNGLHAPAGRDRARPRAWYESNNLIGLVVAPARGLRTAISYTVKASPNHVAGTSHETSFALSYDGDRGLAALHPSAVATWRPKGGAGGYAQVGIEPERALAGGDDAPTLSLPLLAGLGTGGFYQQGTGSLAFGSAGLALTHKLRLGFAQASLRTEMVALVRARGLARLDGPDANRRRVIPVGQVTLTLAR